jgi:hypothetical protein
MGSEIAEKCTADIGLAAYLSLRHPLKHMKSNGGGRSLFVFDFSPDLEEDCLHFLSRKAVVEPISFLEQVRSLKGGLR